jgi:hypothetical protein
MSAETLDIVAQGVSRLASQYSDRPKFIAYIKALLAAYQELEGVLQFMALQTDIDIAEGVNLDIIGDIVGISRILPDSIAVQFFGFEFQPGATPFGENGQLGIGARFREEGEPETATSVLADPEYRLLIRAKIIKNHGTGTGEDILSGLSFLFGAPLTVVEDYGTMAIRVSIGRQLTFQEKSIVRELDILPRPAGVRIVYMSTFDFNGYFGFADNPNAKGFGEEGDPSIGGTFAEEF